MPTPDQYHTVSKHSPLKYDRSSRREFLRRLGVFSVAAIAAQQAKTASCAQTGEGKLPRIKFGKYSLSRLICGANPFNAGSHLSVFVDYEMRQYYTPEQILKTLHRCQEVGINCWQGSSGNYELYRRFTQQGGRMHYLSLGYKPADIEDLSKAGAIGIAHHGERTDRSFKAAGSTRFMIISNVFVMPA